ncbi:MAG: ATP-grasp domain-containing protein, partial [Alphaproteobacteria bacterium]
EIESVAIYASDDADSLHVKVADRSIALPGRGVPAYLDIDSVIATAKQAGCEAVHPGYGFLSESATFAQACEEAGLVFVGPTPQMLLKLGDKAAARALAVELDVPLLPGTNKPTSIEEAHEFLDGIEDGSNIILKALLGGGGRGARVVHEKSELNTAFASCTSEAKKAFGSGELFVEQYLPRARHIEVQILGDGRGGLIHLGERDCTLQRRHQKVIEFAPAPGLPPEVRDALRHDALKMAAEVNYRGAATFEFLLDSEKTGRYWFLEVNPRIQVEHTVTEEISGVDLVQAQLRIAAGESLADIGLSQEQFAEPGKCAVQLRLNMERIEPSGDILPASGILSRYDMPSGPGVRIDGFGYSGYRATPTYDTLLSKIIVSVGNIAGNSYKVLILKALRALEECHVEGIDTNLYFQRALLEHPALADNRIYTRFIEEHGEALVARAIELQAAELSDTAKADATDAVAISTVAAPPGNLTIPAPMFGNLVDIVVSEGDVIHKGQTLAIIEAMKMEHVVTAPEGGVVTKLLLAPGAQLNPGTAIAFIDPEAAPEQGGGTDEEQSIDAIPPSLSEVMERKNMLLDEHRPDAVAKRRKTGQRTARENVAAVCDPDTFKEYGGLALAEQRSRRSEEELIRLSPADGLIAGTARINSGRFPGSNSHCAVLAYDYTVFAGTQGRRNHRKMDRVFEIAHRQNLPLILFAEGGGGRPGDVDSVMVSGLITTTFSALARRSGRAPVIGIASGRCFAGNAAILGCCDVIIATRGANIGMGGPAMIEGGGLGVYRSEEIGPVEVQTANGVIDLLVEDEEEGAAIARKYLAYFQGPLDTWDCADQRALRHLVPENRKRAFDVRRIIETLCDSDSVLELRTAYGAGIVTALARIEGRPFGLIANDSQHLSGAIDSDGSSKASRFIELCNTYDLPVVSLCDTPGFMVGPESEKTAAVRQFSRFFIKAAALEAPLMTVVLRRAYGLGAMAMAGGDLHSPNYTVSWPMGEFGGMGLEGGVRLGFKRELEAIDDPVEREALFQKMVAAAYQKGKGLNVAVHFEIDDVIDPADTRRLISAMLKGHTPRPWGSVSHHYIDPW